MQGTETPMLRAHDIAHEALTLCRQCWSPCPVPASLTASTQAADTALTPLSQAGSQLDTGQG